MSEKVSAILKELRRRFEALYGPRLVRMVLYGSQDRVPQEAPVRSVEWTPPVNPVLRWRNGVKPWYGVHAVRAVGCPCQGGRE